MFDWQQLDDGETYYLKDRTAVVYELFAPRLRGDRCTYSAIWTGTAVRDGHSRNVGIHSTSLAAMAACEAMLEAVTA
jgi:hypothetical protein